MEYKWLVISPNTGQTFLIAATEEEMNEIYGKMGWDYVKTNKEIYCVECEQLKFAKCPNLEKIG